MTKIGDDAFKGCDSLKNPIIVNDMFVKLPESFEGNYSIPFGIKSICRGAFFGCKSLRNIEIPDSFTEIWFGAFRDCISLTSIKIPNSITKIGNNAFEGCKWLTKIEIPNSVTKIGDNAFYGCSSLTSIKIPCTVTKIGCGAFYNCSNLTEIHLRVKDPRSIAIDVYVFYKFDPSQCMLYVPIGTGYAYRHHPVFCRFKEVMIER